MVMVAFCHIYAELLTNVKRNDTEKTIVYQYMNLYYKAKKKSSNEQNVKHTLFKGAKSTTKCSPANISLEKLFSTPIGK